MPMKILCLAATVAGTVALLVPSSQVAAQATIHHNAPAVHFDEEERHHISVFTGATDIINHAESAFTLGIDYEFRINRLVGLGFIAERAFGDIDATTLFAVTDIHLWRGLVTQLGAGFESSHGETYFAARIGALYEIEISGGFTFAPQFHYDFSEEDSLVFGLSIGRAF